MADIDKVLPNISEQPEQTTDELAVEMSEQLQEQAQPGEVEIINTEDGGVEVDFDPNQMDPGDASDFNANLAEFLDSQQLTVIGSGLYSNYVDYKTSRKDWEKAYTSGLDLLGFKYEDRSEPFSGASGASHPVLAEAVTQFQALAYKELLPANGPVRTQVVGVQTPEKTQQSNRVKDFMNYQLMDKMKEYEADFDQMLFYLPLSGSAFKKIYYDEVLQRAVSKFVPAEDLIVPYTATSLEDAEAIVHKIKISENELRKQQVAGFYRDIDIAPGQDNLSDIEKKEMELEGVSKTGKDEGVFTLLECHVNLDLEGFEDMGPDGEPTGIKLPYIVTIEENSREILSIRRNYEQNDPLKNKIEYFVHFKFLPGLGFYGFGLIHMIGGLSRTATSALRQLIDAGTLSNLPAGFKQRGIRIRDDAQSIKPGEFRDVDAPGGNIRDAFMTLPFKEPSQTLLNLLGVVVNAGQRFASIADLQVGDGNQQAAVGTTVALLERGSRTMSAIHKRIYSALKNEFKLLARVFKLYLPAEYPYDVVGGQRTVKQLDFDDRVDILPVADPNIFSQTQRISLAQTELQLAMSNPQMHNLYQAYRNMYEAIGVKDVDTILIRPQPPQPKDPALEHIDALAGKPFQAFPGQDHRAHITAHLNFMATNIARNNPPVMAGLEKNIFEHISLMSQEQVEMEFREEMQQLQQMQMQAQQNPQMAQQMQMQAMQITQKIESRKAVLIAEMMEEFKEEEKKITSQFDNDPIAKLRARELDLRAQENARKEKEGEERINLDKMRTMMNQQNQDEKLQQNEELANLRADTSIQKTILSKNLGN
ncbi:MAG: portal protein [Flavobacteriaceae bacterium]|tara:strand:- start:2364 stop:4817 length:2454 start_codon:yes stop_codon:yes gene_type:complete